MKPRIKPLPKTGDSTPFLVNGRRVVIFMGTVMCTGKTAWQLLKEEIQRNSPPLHSHSG